MNNVVLSAEAIKDLQEIKKYIAEELCNEQAAISTLSKITENLHRLELFAECGKPLSAIVEFDTDFRFLVCGNYLAFYTVTEKQINIARILYGRRNYLQILFGE